MVPYIPVAGLWLVPSYYVFLVLGATVGGYLGWREAHRLGYSKRQIFSFYLIVFPGALFLGWLNGCLFIRDFYVGLAQGELWLNGGLVTYGVIFGALLLGYLYERLHKRPAGTSLDLIVLVLPLMFTFTRIGCFLNGCCYGRETDGFGGVYLPGAFGEWAYRYPTQILLSAFNLGLFLWMWARRKREHDPGSQVLPFLLVYFAGRLMIDSLRDLPPLVWGLGFHQLSALLILAVLIILSLRRRRSGVVV